MNIKFSYYDKWHRKKYKAKCIQRHPPLDCDGQCDDKITCIKRHRVQCKEGTTCIYLKTNSCEYLYTGSNNQGNISQNTIEQLNTNNKAVELKLNNIETRLQTFRGWKY